MNINSGQSVVWDVVPGASAYDVELLNAAGGTSLGTFERTTSSIPASVLFAGRSFGNYTVQVRGKETAGAGAWSGLLSLTFVSLPAPSNLRVE